MNSHQNINLVRACGADSAIARDVRLSFRQRLISDGFIAQGDVLESNSTYRINSQINNQTDTQANEPLSILVSSAHFNSGIDSSVDRSPNTHRGDVQNDTGVMTSGIKATQNSTTDNSTTNNDTKGYRPPT